MNTPDQAPKDGDFVAYIEEIEQRQLRSNASTAANTMEAINKPLAALTSVKVDPVALVATAAVAKAVPIGLMALGIVLVIAGLLFNGGIFLVAIGIFILWQAARSIARSARAATEAGKSQAAQQVASILATQAQRKKSAGK